jgi:hypothetical protein
MEESAPLRVDIGHRLVIELLDASGGSETMQVTVVPDRAANFSSGLIGESTRLGQTLLNQPAGALLAYPVGDLKAVRVLSIAPGDLGLVESSAEQRQEAVEKTRLEIARQNATNFAASFSGKWGDYDPDGMAKWDLDAGSKASSEDK